MVFFFPQLNIIDKVRLNVFCCLLKEETNKYAFGCKTQWEIWFWRVFKRSNLKCVFNWKVFVISFKFCIEEKDII